MDVELLARRLKYLREEAKLTKRELAARAGLQDASIITRYEKADISEPGMDKIGRLAAALGVTIDALTAADPEAVETALTLRWQAKLADLESRVRQLEATQGISPPEDAEPAASAGSDEGLLARIGAWPLDDDDAPVELDQEVAAGARGGWLADDGPPAPETPRGRLARQYVVRIAGTCLEGYASPGDEVVFWPRDTADIGDLVVVADGDQALIKFLAEDQAVQYLLPLVGDAIPLRPDMRIVGVVAHVRRPPPRPPRLPRRPAPHPPGEDPP